MQYFSIGFFVFTCLFVYLWWTLYLCGQRKNMRKSFNLNLSLSVYVPLLHPLTSLLFPFTFRNLFVMRSCKAYVEYSKHIYDCWTLHEGKVWAINKSKECLYTTERSFILYFQHFKRNEIITMWFECTLLHVVHVSVNQYRSKIG